MSDIPVEAAYAFCPRCGIENNDIGSIPFHCSSCEATLFFGPVAAVGGLIVNQRNELLFVRRARNPGLGKWGLPGGFVDRDESVEEALAREVLEETSLKVRQARYLMSRPNRYAYRGMISPVVDFFFECQVHSLVDLSLAADELDHHIWVRPGAEHLGNMAFESNRIAVELWMQENPE
ncbi:NUDIX hydrolase [Rubripirellula reticaptiva]|uniref:Bifunctional NMN adenylyltransferase/Nudix hydrolase n=1 Tax=Rubripirellula reticaptiva TaxID=2528013 RepID=A0A5C6F1Y3_9BACT|nr:NUDIX domain-containing protein [Rubripirellula reticaptiva]TWU55368.1 Bifunctional NMN adenylyltransferase/Nudix hydrolase [Rubripirellula reticaptiva]